MRVQFPLGLLRMLCIASARCAWDTEERFESDIFNHRSAIHFDEPVVAQPGRALRKSNPGRDFNSSNIARGAVVVGSNPTHRFLLTAGTLSAIENTTHMINKSCSDKSVLNIRNVTHTAICFKW